MGEVMSVCGVNKNMVCYKAGWRKGIQIADPTCLEQK